MGMMTVLTPRVNAANGGGVGLQLLVDYPTLRVVGVADTSPRFAVRVEGDDATLTALAADPKYPQVRRSSPTFAEVRDAIREALARRPDNGVTITLGAQSATLPSTPGFAARFTQLLAAYREAGTAGTANVTIRVRGGTRTVTLNQLRTAYKLYMDGLAAITAPLDQVDAATTTADLDSIAL
jgi:hypothetical protein